MVKTETYRIIYFDLFNLFEFQLIIKYQDKTNKGYWNTDFLNLTFNVLLSDMLTDRKKISNQREITLINVKKIGAI